MNASASEELSVLVADALYTSVKIYKDEVCAVGAPSTPGRLRRKLFPRHHLRRRRRQRSLIFHAGFSLFKRRQRARRMNRHNCSRSWSLSLSRWRWVCAWSVAAWGARKTNDEPTPRKI